MHIGMTDIEIARYQASGYSHYPVSSPRRSNRSLPIRCCAVRRPDTCCPSKRSISRAPSS
jgi:hypothetical protein